MKRKFFGLLMILSFMLLLGSCGKEDEPIKYVVKYYDADMTTVICQVEVEEGTDALYNLGYIPARSGYTFIGWDKEATNVKENLDIYPVFEEIPQVPYFDIYIDSHDNIRILGVIVSALESTSEKEYKKNLGVLYRGNTTDFSKVDFEKESETGKSIHKSLNDIFSKIAVLEEDGSYTFKDEELISVYTIKQLDAIYAQIRESYLFKEFLYMIYSSYLKDAVETKYPNIKLDLTKDEFFAELDKVDKIILEVIKVLKDDFGDIKFLTPTQYKEFLLNVYNNIKDLLDSLTITDIEEILKNYGFSFADIDKFVESILNFLEKIGISNFTRIIILIREGKLAFIDVSLTEVYKLGVELIDILRGLENYQTIILPNMAKYSKQLIDSIPKELLPADFDFSNFKGTPEEVDKLLLDIRDYLTKEIEKNNK